MSKHSKDRTGGHEDDAIKDGGELPSIPGATMTGMRTFVNRQGEEVKSEMEVSTYSASATENQDTLPISKQGLTPGRRDQSSFHGRF